MLSEQMNMHEVLNTDFTSGVTWLTLLAISCLCALSCSLSFDLKAQFVTTAC